MGNFELDFEVETMKRKGFALAGRLDTCRVYRGNSKVEVIGTPRVEEVAEVEKLTAKIIDLRGHEGWQGGKRRPLRSTQDRSDE